LEESHDLAAAVDPVSYGAYEGSSPGDIDGGEAAARIQEAMLPSCVNETSHAITSSLPKKAFSISPTPRAGF
jgi:hypothetical protein